MFGLLKKVIDSKPDSGAGVVVPEHKKHVAACVLMVEAVHADNECSEEEMGHLFETIKTKFDLTHDEAEELVELANVERKNSVDLWEFTNHINQHFSKDEKMAVIEDVWRIVLIDGHLEQHEDHLMHKLANLLRLKHKELIEAKLNARKQF